MTDDDSDFADMPSGRRARLQYSISNLWDQFGNVDNVALGLTINIGLASLGLIAFVLGDGLVAWAGIAWAILNGYPLIQWALGL